MNKLTENRPWGKFDQFTLNEKCTVKILSVNSNSMLSLQYHNHRREFWHILDGEAKVIIGDEEFEANQGDEFVIEQNIKHRIITEDSATRILEVSFGRFDEDDIVRLKDIYKRT